MSTFLGREEQAQCLTLALRLNVPPCLFLWGPPSSGKTLILKSALEENRGVHLHVAKINGVEVLCGMQAFLESLLMQLVKGSEDEEGDEEDGCCRPCVQWRRDAGGRPVKCENLRVFVQRLRELNERHRRKCPKAPTFVIIIDCVEHLTKEGDMMEVLVRLQELVQGKVVVIFSTSTLYPTRFPSVMGIRGISVHFPQYTKEEVTSIMLKYHKPTEGDLDVFGWYVQMAVNVYYQSCNDVRKLVQLCDANWEFVKSQEEKNLSKLWKLISPVMKEEFQTINSHIVQIRQEMVVCPDEEDLNASFVACPADKKSGDGEVDYGDMSTYMKYLLLSAYLATSNPPSSDKRFFVKSAAAKTPKSKRSKWNHLPKPLEDAEPSSTKSLRSFEQNRLKAIFAFLVNYCSGDTYYEDCTDWPILLTTLCQSQYIQNLGEDTSGNIKYRCTADYDFMEKIAKNVNLELDKYLYRRL